MKTPFCFRRTAWALALALFSPSLLATNAGSVEITLHGNIVASSCTLSEGDDSQTIVLGDWAVKNFTDSGVRSQPVYFGIALTDCSASTAELTFSGTQDSSSAELLALDSDSTAENIAIEILDADKNRVPLNQSVSATIDSDGTAAYTFYANYISTGTVSAGTANGTLTFTINYS